jgi:hypothetical protein
MLGTKRKDEAAAKLWQVSRLVAAFIGYNRLVIHDVSYDGDP